MGIRDRPIAPRSPWQNGRWSVISSTVRPMDCPSTHQGYSWQQAMRRGSSARSAGIALTMLLCSATGSFATSSTRIKNITTRLARTYHCTRTDDPALRADRRSHAGDASSGRASPPIYPSVSFRQGQVLDNPSTPRLFAWTGQPWEPSPSWRSLLFRQPRESRSLNPCTSSITPALTPADNTACASRLRFLGTVTSSRTF